jgi:pimeloyl-ACP methyl ester carboxylesterase
MAAVLVATACSATGGAGIGAGGVAPSGSPATAAVGTTAAPTTTTPGATGATTPTPVPAPMAWSPCQGDAGPSGMQCGTLRVPLDYAHPGGSTITIALDRHPATGTRTGSLLIDPGGPGASGVDFLPSALGLLSPTILSHFDVVGFDPRGVARSAPVTCATGPALDRYFDLDPAPPTAAGFEALVVGARAFDQGCQALSGAILPYVGTDNAARDMDQIRQAVGDAKLTYLGFSYGTFLGATYAELFPANVRAMTLDGAVDPALDAVAANLAQSAAFDQELNAFFADCASRATCAWKPGGSLPAAFDALMTRIRTTRLPGVGTRTLGPGEALYGVAAPLYDRSSWPDLADALNRASHGDGSVLLQFFDAYAERNDDGTYGNEQEAFTAVSCMDQPWPADPAVLQREAVAAAKAAPRFGAADLYGGLPCSLWPIAPTGHPHAIRAPGAPPIVVVGSTGDPATPYAGAQALASELARGVLVTRVGEGHTGYPFSSCVRQAVDGYLLNLTVPAAGLTCPTP